VDTKQRSTTAKDPSSEGMLLRTLRGVPDRDEKDAEIHKKDEEIQKKMKKTLDTGRPR
jgi:hypothetical protein